MTDNNSETMTSTTDGIGRTAMWPAHLQGIAVGIVLGTTAQTIHALGGLMVLVLAVFLMTYGFISEKKNERERQEDTTQESELGTHTDEHETDGAVCLPYCPNCGDKLESPTGPYMEWSTCPNCGDVCIEFHRSRETNTTQGN